jgi:hypothetical protein
MTAVTVSLQFKEKNEVCGGRSSGGSLLYRSGVVEAGRVDTGLV